MLLSVVLPILTLVYASVQRLAVAFPAAANFTLDNYRQALTQNAVRYAMSNSLILGVLTATIGVALTGMLSWLIHRSRLPGRGLLEYTVMFPQAVPRLVFAFGMMWAWLVFPIPIYGTLWLLLIAYLTVFLPLGVRTISSVLLQLDKSLEECGEVCGASWAHRMRTITMPLLRPGLLAAWMLLFIASVRELGASILLMGPHSQVITPAIVDAWFGSSSELTSAMALIQSICSGAGGAGLHPGDTPGIATGRISGMPSDQPTAHIEVENLEIHYGPIAAVGPVSFTVPTGRQVTLLGPSGCGKTTTLARHRRAGTPECRNDPDRRPDRVLVRRQRQRAG